MKNEQRHLWHLLAMACMSILWFTQPGMGLVVSEIMYHPTDAGGTLEFIELYNNRAVFEDLTNYAFTNGIQYVFRPGTIIRPKSYLVVARDPVALEQAYGITGVEGPFSGRLDNDGERIELSNGGGGIILSLGYDDELPWPLSPDGTGHSLILARLGGDPDEASTWVPSTFVDGTPGEPDEIQVGQEDPTSVTLVSVGHPGRYFKGTQEPAPDSQNRATTAWTEIDFYDNTARTPWTDGPSGYGYSNEADELQYIGTETNDMSGRYMSIYVRLPFTVTQSQFEEFSQLRAQIHYDDGFVLYLNGVRVAASEGISGNPPAYDASGGTATDPPAASVDLTSYLNLLVPGTNILAIQAHNANLSGSSDCFASPVLQAFVGETSDIADP
ncbi:MAG: lamin tail domain-containing protein, partial [Planctomycetota bacterium]